MTTLRDAVVLAINALKNSKPYPRNKEDEYVEQGYKEHFAALAALKNELAKLEGDAWTS